MNALIATHRVASSRFSIGFKNNGFEERAAVTVRIGPRHWNMVPRISI